MNCLDSSFLVDFLDPETEHHDDAVTWMDEHGDEALAVPAICAFEVLRGTARAGDERFDRATLVASPALECGYTLVTRDRDFEAIEELTLEYFDER